MFAPQEHSDFTIFFIFFLGSGKTVWAVNEFAFSPCGHFLAVASQDGFLRIFNYDTMEPVGRARSYFGGFLCVCWSPDGKYVVCGGEDDLVTVYRYFFYSLKATGSPRLVRSRV